MSHYQKFGIKIIRALQIIRALMLLLVLLITTALFNWHSGPSEIAESTFYVPAAKHEKGPGLSHGDIDPISGLVIDDHFELVRATCGACHSTVLVTQNRATRNGWQELIVWMQQTQELWDLGENEKPILDYLAKHYAPSKKGRRQNLENVEWYVLE